MSVLGIDPGMDGAAVLLRDGRVSELPLLFRDFTMKAAAKGKQYDIPHLYRALTGTLGASNPLVVLEVGRGGPPGISSAASIQIGLIRGIIMTTCAVRGWSMIPVAPAVWQRELFGKNTDPKARAVLYVSNVLPDFDATCGRFKKPHQGVIDAAALALYGAKVSKP